VSQHAVIAVSIASVMAVTRLIAYAINDDKRWPRFRNLALFVVFLALAIAAGWWLLAGGAFRASSTTSVRRAGRPHDDIPWRMAWCLLSR
jgi:uncharacterized membrane protein YqjE